MMAKINETEEEEEEEDEENGEKQEPEERNQQQKNYHQNHSNIQPTGRNVSQNINSRKQAIAPKTTSTKTTNTTKTRTNMDFHGITLGGREKAGKIMQTKSNQTSTLPMKVTTMDGKPTKEEEEEIGIIMKKNEAIKSYDSNNNDNGYVDNPNFDANANHHHSMNIEFGSSSSSLSSTIVGMNQTNIGNNNDDDDDDEPIETKHSNNSEFSGKGEAQNANDIGIIHDNHNQPTSTNKTPKKIVEEEEEEEQGEKEPKRIQSPGFGYLGSKDLKDYSIGTRSQVDKFNGNILEPLSNEESGNISVPIYDIPINRNPPNGTITKQSSSSSSSCLKTDLPTDLDRKHKQQQQQKQQLLLQHQYQYYDQPNQVPSDALLISDMATMDINSNLHKTVSKLRAEIANLRTDNVRLQNWNGSLQEKIFKMFQEDTATRTILDYGGGRLGQSLINISTAGSYGSLDGGRDNLRKQINYHSMDSDSAEHSDRMPAMNDGKMASSVGASRRPDRFNFRKRNSFLSETVPRNLLEQISLKQRNRILGSRIIMEHNDRCIDDTINMRQDSKILGLKNNTERELFLNQNKMQSQRPILGLSNYFGSSHKREQEKNGSCSPSFSFSPSLSFMVAPNEDAHSDHMNRDPNRNENRDPPSPQLNSMNLHQKRKLLRSNHLQRLQISMSIDQQQQLPLLFEPESRQNPFNKRTNNHLNDDEVNNNNYSADGQIGNYSFNNIRDDENIINAKNINNVGDYSGTEMVVLRRPRMASPSITMINPGGNASKIEAKTSKGSLYHLADYTQTDDDENRKSQQQPQIISNQLSVGVDKRNYIVRTNFLGGTKNYKRSRQTFKMILIGDSTVGKTSLIHRIRTGQFISNQFPTIGIDFQTIQVRLDGEYYDVQLWDTAGQERYHSITTNYFRRVDAICMMYDVSKERTFLNVRHWLQSIRDTLFHSIPLLLVANKIDLRQHTEYEGYLVPPEQGYRLAAEIGNCCFIETSCLNGINVDQAILLATKMVLIHQHHQPQQKPPTGEDLIRMKTINKQIRPGCC